MRPREIVKAQESHPVQLLTEDHYRELDLPPLPKRVLGIRCKDLEPLKKKEHRALMEMTSGAAMAISEYLRPQDEVARALGRALHAEVTKEFVTRGEIQRFSESQLETMRLRRGAGEPFNPDNILDWVDMSPSNGSEKFEADFKRVIKTPLKYHNLKPGKISESLKYGVKLLKLFRDGAKRINSETDNPFPNSFPLDTDLLPHKFFGDTTTDQYVVVAPSIIFNPKWQDKFVDTTLSALYNGSSKVLNRMFGASMSVGQCWSEMDPKPEYPISIVQVFENLTHGMCASIPRDIDGVIVPVVERKLGLRSSSSRHR